MSSQTHAHASDKGDLQTEGRTIVRWAGVYDLVANVMALGHEGMLRQLTVERAGVQPGNRVLDVGCGTGSLTIVAARQAGPMGQAFGIDASPEMIKVAAHKRVRDGVPVAFRTGLIERLEFPDQSFDVVLSSLMMHHLTDDLRRRGLREICRVLKPGGRVFIVDFNGGAGTGLHGLVARLGHAGPRLHAAVPNLPGLLTETGFAEVSSGSVGLPGVGFTTGRTHV
jgi:ubiquinone/menaquinone biosynthesis C-methylase UbiE